MFVKQLVQLQQMTAVKAFALVGKHATVKSLMASFDDGPCAIPCENNKDACIFVPVLNI